MLNSSQWVQVERLAAENLCEAHDEGVNCGVCAGILAARELLTLRSAVKWALGEEGDFAPRAEGQGAYWWRSELRKRIALSTRRKEG